MVHAWLPNDTSHSCGCDAEELHEEEECSPEVGELSKNLIWLAKDKLGVKKSHPKIVKLLYTYSKINFDTII